MSKSITLFHKAIFLNGCTNQLDAWLLSQIYTQPTLNLQARPRTAIGSQEPWLPDHELFKSLMIASLQYFRSRYEHSCRFHPLNSQPHLAIYIIIMCLRARGLARMKLCRAGPEQPRYIGVRGARSVGPSRPLSRIELVPSFLSPSNRPAQPHESTTASASRDT